MNILMISTDKEIMDPTSAVYSRMKLYASVCDALHIIVLTHYDSGVHVHDNLLLYPVSGNGVMQRMRAHRRAREIAGHQHIDIVTVQSPDELGLIAYMIAKKYHLALQLQVHTDMMSIWYRRASLTARLRYMFARFILPRADCVRVVSHRIARSLIHECHITADKIFILPIYTNKTALMRHASTQEYNKHSQHAPCAIVSVGRFLEKEKNFSMLIRAMAMVVRDNPEATLTIVGDGPDKAYYKSLIGVYRLENNVILQPWQNNMSLIYPHFDLFVLPSYIEGWGRVVIEAMAAGLAVVMTDVGLAGEIVKDGVQGIVVPVDDQPALVRALITLCADSALRKKLGEAARETVQAFGTQEDYLRAWQKSFDCCKRIIKNT